MSTFTRMRLGYPERSHEVTACIFVPFDFIEICR